MQAPFSQVKGVRYSMFIWNFTADLVLKQIIDWLYKQMIGFLGDFFSMMPLTQTDKDRIRHCAGNDELVEKTIAELIKKHTVNRGNSHEQHD